MQSSKKISFNLALLACFTLCTIPTNATKATNAAQAAPQRALQAAPRRASQAVSVEAKENGFTAYQTSSTMGDQDAFVTSTAVKIADRSHGTVVVATAPQWKVFAYNTHTKRICSFTSPRTFTGIGDKLANVTGGVTLYNIPLKPTGKTVLHGISAIELQTPKSFVDKLVKDKERESADPRFVQSAQMLVAEKVNLTPEAATVLSKFYGVPLQRAMPLQFKYINCRGDLNTILLTSELKPIKLAAADFEVPKGFETVTDFSKLENRPVIKGPPTRKIIETVKKI
ncbi:hypothetical protein BH11CYA1_BH11CYA1_20210 [soil metagenome]